MSDLVEFIEAEIDGWLGKAVVQDSAIKKQLYMDYVDRFRQVAEALRSLEWMSVETLPEQRGSLSRSKAMLIYCPEIMCTFTACYNFTEQEWEHFAPGATFVYDKISHWMPLPTPPGKS